MLAVATKKKNPNPKGKGGFQKGKSGNPKGRAVEVEKGKQQIKQLLEPHVEKAISIVAKLTSSEDEKIQLAAAKDILDRVYGKATQQMDLGATKEVAALLTVKLNGPVKKSGAKSRSKRKSTS